MTLANNVSGKETNWTDDHSDGSGKTQIDQGQRQEWLKYLFTKLEALGETENEAILAGEGGRRRVRQTTSKWKKVDCKDFVVP